MDIIELIENMQKTLSQTEAVLIATSANDQFTSLNEDTLSNLLWLIGDNLRNVKKDMNILLEGIEHIEA